MAISPPLVKHATEPTAPTYGKEPVYLEVCLIGQGTSAPIVGSIGAVGANSNPPGSAEVQTIVRSSPGVYVITLFDSYYARIYSSADIDDTANLGAYATIGNWTNLGCLGAITGPTSFTLRTWNASGAAATDVPLNTAVYMAFRFKKTFTGNAA